MATSINSGIYTITNSVTGVIYVGSSVDLTERRARHFRDLRQNIHFNSHLQRSYNKHGMDTFVFQIVERCEPEMLIAREQYWIDEKRKTFRLFNKSPKAGNQLGIKRSEETKRRMSEAQKGKVFSEETREKMRLAKIGTSYRRGKKASEETRRRIGDSKRGVKASEETRRLLSQKRMGNKNALGFKQSQETVRKRIEASRRTRQLRKQEAI